MAVRPIPRAYDVIVVFDSKKSGSSAGAGVDLRPLPVVIHEAKDAVQCVLVVADHHARIVDCRCLGPVRLGIV